jgi:hypothetical protein
MSALGEPIGVVVPATGDPRVVRIFVSSTFLDMQDERERLMKQVFPRLRRDCSERGIVLNVVDLRWGVSDEQRAEGRVLPICLAEIERCRPWFIGLLGDRYGWIPEELPPPLLHSLPWLEAHRGRSITELELTWGALLEPERARQAFVYMRTSRQGTTGDEPAASRAQLEALKGRIRARVANCREGYVDAVELGELVYSDLRAALDALYPTGATEDPLDRERAGHQAFAHSCRVNYIDRPDLFALLDEHVAQPGSPLLVTGAAGQGKSALLANWVGRRQRSDLERDCNILVFEHYVGATASSRDLVGMLQRLLGELGRALQMSFEIPDDLSALRVAFLNGLMATSGRATLVFVIDGLDQFSDDVAAEMTWIGLRPPAHVRFVMSARGGRALEVARARGWTLSTLELLGAADRARLIAGHLAQFGKTLDAAPLQRIAETPAAGNPLYLRTLLEEVRLWGDPCTLNECVAGYLTSSGPAELLQKVMARYETDFEEDHPGLVRKAMAFLWAARRGLSESELLSALGTKGQPLPAAHWSPISLALENGLASSEGLLTFAHDHWRDAVAQRYLREDGDEQLVHAYLAQHFQLTSRGRRAVEELPWQLMKAEEWSALAQLLASPAFFRAGWALERRAVKRYWSELERRSNFRAPSVLKAVLDDPEIGGDNALEFSALLGDLGYPTEAAALVEQVCRQARTSGEGERLTSALLQQSLLSIRTGDMDRALDAAREAEELAIANEKEGDLAEALGARARVLTLSDRTAEADALYQREEQIWRRLGRLDGLQASLHNQAIVLRKRGQYAAALERLRDQEQLCRELRDDDGLWASLDSQASALYALGRGAEAIRLELDAERLCGELGNAEGVASCLVNRATFLADGKDLDEAWQLAERAEQAFERLGSREGLATTANVKGRILELRNDMDAALIWVERGEQLSRELHDHSGVAAAMTDRARLLSYQLRRPEALEMECKASALFRELGDEHGLAISLDHQGVLQLALGRPEEAQRLHDEALSIARRLGLMQELATSLGNQAHVQLALGNPEAALSLHLEEGRLWRELQNEYALAVSLGNRGALIQEAGDRDAALTLYREQEQLARAGDYPEVLAMALGNQGVIAGAVDDYASAEQLLSQQEAIYRRIEKLDSLAVALTNRAEVLIALGRAAEAASALDEASALAERHGVELVVAPIAELRAKLLVG